MNIFRMTNKEELLFLKDILYDIFNNNEILYQDYSYIKQFVKDSMSFFFDNINEEQFNLNFDKLLRCKFEFNNIEGILLADKIIVPEGYKKLVEHVNFIENIPQPEQRTEEWFNLRKNMITASCAAQAIGENPYPNQKPADLILDKLNLGPPYKDNKFVHHGKKYEEIATKIYENAYNIRVKEYGLIPHISKPVVPFVGASPDGIGSKFDLKYNFSPLIGRMLEIKCPLSRQIKLEGKIDGEICPHYYFCQVQQQLECCDLDYCDFWQCTLKEYENKEDMLNDKVEYIYKQEQNDDLIIPNNCKYGCIIQLLPKSKITRFCLFDAKYIYPENIDMTLFEYDKWLLDEITNLNRKYPDLMKDYVFDRVLYWKLTVCHNVTIERDKNWFKSNYIKFKDLWEKIVLYRKNKSELNNFLKEVNKKKRNKIKTENECLFVDSESSEDT